MTDISSPACVYDFSATLNNGQTVNLNQYRGQGLLIVNTASQCGFTPHYAGLEDLHRQFAPQGFAVLGFPCNQFGGQEPEDDAVIAAFCAAQFKISFPLFAKIDVNGPQAAPLFVFLQQMKPGLFGTRRIKWNFTKFLVSRRGEVLARFAPSVKPAALAGRIVQALREPPPDSRTDGAVERSPVCVS